MSTLVHLRLPCLLHLNILYVDTWANLCIFFLKFASANIFASVSCVFYPLKSLNHVRICASIPSIAPMDFQKQDHVIARFSFYFTKKIWTLYEVLRNPVNSRKSDYLLTVPILTYNSFYHYYYCNRFYLNIKMAAYGRSHFWPRSILPVT